MKKKTIGIIGGMGPLATADLFQKIVLHTKASCDQEHIPILIDNNTAIPDRTASLLSGGEDPFPQMKNSALRLQQAGADFLIMPCNTAHYFLNRVQAEVSIPFLNMLELTCRALTEQNIRCAGLLSTTATARIGLYKEIAERFGIRLLRPDDAGQEAVMSMIYQGVKAGSPTWNTDAVNAAVSSMTDDGAEIMILGCTELPLAQELYHLDFPTIDPTLELAKGAIRFAGGTVI